MKHLMLMLAIALASCKHGRQPPAPELPSAMCTKANNGQTVSVSGFLAMPELMFGCANECGLTIASSKGARDGMTAVFGAGTRPGAVDPVATHGDLTTTGAKPTDSTEIHVHPNDGRKLLGVGDLVRVTGQLSMLHERGKVRCSMSVDTVAANDGSPRPPEPHVERMVFVDVDPHIDIRKRAIIRRIARADLLAHGIASRFLDRETGSFFFESSLRHGTLDAPVPEWWPDALRGAWTSGVATCKQAARPRDCAHDLGKTLWDQWLTAQRASRFVYVTESGGESFVPGERTVRIIDAPASTTEAREDQLGKVATSLANGAGQEYPRLRAEEPAKPDPKANPLYIDLKAD